MARYNLALNQEARPLLLAPLNFNSAGNNVIVTAIPNRVIRVYRVFLEVQNATTLTFRSVNSSSPGGGGTALSGPIPLHANAQFVLNFDTKPWFQTNQGDDFIINSSAAVQVSGQLAFSGGMVGVTDGELREDGSFELREDVSFELRDGP